MRTGIPNRATIRMKTTGPRPRLLFGPAVVLLAALSATLRTQCAADPSKIVFVPGAESHGYGMHEHRAGLLLLARSLKQQWPQLETVLTEKNAWPDSAVLADADALVMACEGSKHVALAHLDEVSALAGREKVLSAYQDAIAREYRFYSFGDAMLIF